MSDGNDENIRGLFKGTIMESFLENVCGMLRETLENIPEKCERRRGPLEEGDRNRRGIFWIIKYGNVKMEYKARNGGML